MTLTARREKWSWPDRAARPLGPITWTDHLVRPLGSTAPHHPPSARTPQTPVDDPRPVDNSLTQPSDYGS